MAGTPEPPRTEPARADGDTESDTDVETGPDGPAPVDPMAPGKSLFEDDEEAVEPNEPA
jgi:hypothetical protein